MKVKEWDGKCYLWSGLTDRIYSEPDEALAEAEDYVRDNRSDEDTDSEPEAVEVRERLEAMEIELCREVSAPSFSAEDHLTDWLPQDGDCDSFAEAALKALGPAADALNAEIAKLPKLWVSTGVRLDLDAAFGKVEGA